MKYNKAVLYIALIIIVVLLLLLLEFPLEYLLSKSNYDHITVDLVSGIIIRALIICFLIQVARKMNIFSIKLGGDIFSIYNPQALLVPLLVFSMVIIRKFHVYESAGMAQLTLFSLFTFAVGIAEELLFRGMILLLIYKIFINHSHGLLISAFISSLLFGVVHYFNLLNPNNETTFELITSQVIVTTCLGMAFAGIYLRMQNLWPVILIHSLFNFSFGTTKLNPPVVEQTIDKTSMDLTSLIFTLAIWLLLFLGGVIMIINSGKTFLKSKVAHLKI